MVRFSPAPAAAELGLALPGASFSGYDRPRRDTVRRRMTDEQGLRQRVTKQGEEAIGKLAQELLENPLVSGALTRAFETRERAVHAQEVAMGALNLPSASDLERLTRRIRSVSQRLEGIEDGLDRLEQKLQGLGGGAAIEQRLAAIEEQLGRVEKALASAS
jgi:chromosome segregation ATPase